MDFSGIGIWSGELRRSGDAAEVALEGGGALPREQWRALAEVLL